MIHILKDKAGKWYWLAVGKKANTFEELAKSSESYASTQGCLKGAAATSSSCFANHDKIVAVVHNKKNGLLPIPFYFDIAWKIKGEFVSSVAHRTEINWVIKNHIPKGKIILPKKSKALLSLLLLVLFAAACTKQPPPAPPKPIEKLGDWRNNHNIIDTLKN